MFICFITCDQTVILGKGGWRMQGPKGGGGGGSENERPNVKCMYLQHVIVSRETNVTPGWNRTSNNLCHESLNLVPPFHLEWESKRSSATREGGWFTAIFFFLVTLGKHKLMSCGNCRVGLCFQYLVIKLPVWPHKINFKESWPDSLNCSTKTIAFQYYNNDVESETVLGPTN